MAEPQEPRDRFGAPFDEREALAPDVRSYEERKARDHLEYERREQEWRDYERSAQNRREQDRRDYERSEQERRDYERRAQEWRDHARREPYRHEIEPRGCGGSPCAVPYPPYPP